MNFAKNHQSKNLSVGRTHSSLSVSGADYYLNMPAPPSPALSVVTLTPGKSRNIDQDMEALRASRQDNPFIQQVIASRECLVDHSEEESDHANLMAKELTIDVDTDPLYLPEMHEHMIRSPPPTLWPTSPTSKVFQFSNTEEDTLQIVLNNKEKKSELKPKHASWNGQDLSPIKLQIKSHQDRFSLLSPSMLRSSGEDSVRLVNDE